MLHYYIVCSLQHMIIGLDNYFVFLQFQNKIHPLTSLVIIIIKLHAKSHKDTFINFETYFGKLGVFILQNSHRKLLFPRDETSCLKRAL